MADKNITATFDAAAIQETIETRKIIRIAPKVGTVRAGGVFAWGMKKYDDTDIFFVVPQKLRTTSFQETISTQFLEKKMWIILSLNPQKARRKKQIHCSPRYKKNGFTSFPQKKDK